MNIINKKFFATNCLVLMCAIFISLIFFSGNVLAADYPDNQEATILGGHVKATIAYEKTIHRTIPLLGTRSQSIQLWKN